VIIYLDGQAYGTFTNEHRGQPWSRALHAQLLDRLAQDGCPLVVFDIHFEDALDSADDARLAAALRRHGHVALMAEQTRTENRQIIGGAPIPPHALFEEASGTNWGVAALDDTEGIVRKHWPFPSPGTYTSLPWRAAVMAGTDLGAEQERRWLRYYGADGAWTRLSYAAAFTQATNFYRGAVVFIGNKPATPVPDGEIDEFKIPYTRWTGEAVGGVEVLATMFLNLRNGEWLRRPAAWLEALIVLLCALLLGAGLCLVRPWLACTLAAVSALGATLGGAALCHLTDYWFPWLVIAGGQVPVALAWAWSTRRWKWPAWETTQVMPRSTVAGVPYAPDYELFEPPFGKGGFGKVWIVRNVVGQWQALKAVYREKFGNDSAPYDTEFRGITRYKPVSDRHPGLLKVDFVSRHEEEGYFYYVMELGDSLTPGWQEDPRLYKPADLNLVRENLPGQRLPPAQCIEIGVALADALSFLHGVRLTHRDIKPGNVVFVNGKPKLADVGLVGEVRQASEVTSWGGTRGYMPEWPEPPGTVAADIYGLGKLLYVISTGQSPLAFSDLPPGLLEGDDAPLFMRLNRVFIKACKPLPEERYATAAEMHAALLEILPRPNS
jgi:CHASE2 domain-containing sensor protein